MKGHLLETDTPDRADPQGREFGCNIFGGLVEFRTGGIASLHGIGGQETNVARHQLRGDLLQLSGDLSRRNLFFQRFPDGSGIRGTGGVLGGKGSSRKQEKREKKEEDHPFQTAGQLVHQVVLPYQTVKSTKCYNSR